MRINININFKNLSVGRVIKFFVLSDLFLWGGWGLINPLLALFITQKVHASFFVVGSVYSVYWITKSVIQIPVAVFLDKHPGEKDDFYALISALTLAGFAAILFLTVRSTLELYLVTFLQGIAFGLYSPSWNAIFSRHLDKDRYSLDWSLDSTTIGIVSGVAAFIGGFLSKNFGFNIVFILTGFLSLGSSLMLLSIPDLILPKPTIRVPFIYKNTSKDIPTPVEIKKM